MGNVPFPHKQTQKGDLWAKDIVTKAICTKIDNLPKTVELPTMATSR